MTREHLIVNRHTGDWSSITFGQDETALAICSNNGKAPTTHTWTKTNALMTLAYVQSQPDMYDVCEVN